MSIEKLVEECDALILNCSGDTRMMARAVIRRTLEYAAGDVKHTRTVSDVRCMNGEQGFGHAIACAEQSLIALARSLPKAEGEDGSTLPKAE